MAKRPDSFLDIDVTKWMGEFKVPGVDVQAVVASQRKNLDALTQANKLALEGVQALFKRQAEILRQAIEESSNAVKDVAAVVDPQEKMVKQTEFAKQAFERALANARELSEIIAKSNGEAFELLNRRFSAILDEFKDSVHKTK